MKKHFIFSVAIAIIALGMNSCGSSGPMSKSTSTRVDLARTVRVLPSIANLEVNPTHVTATLNAADMASLNKEQIHQTLVSKALKTVDGDVMIAADFTTTKDSENKVSSMTVTGYAANIRSFRTMTLADVEKNYTDSVNQNHPKDKMAMNTMTVTEVEYGTKKSISLSSADLMGKNEEQALKLAKEKLLRQEKMDVLYGVQYSITMNGGAITSFTLTAFPGKYVNYRQTTMQEQLALRPGTEPAVYFQTIAADIRTVDNRVQYTFRNQDLTAKEETLKQTARVQVLQLKKADFLLNETFYFDYSNNAITQLTICGTPAVYTNFRPLQKDELVDVKLVPFVGAEEQEAPKSLFGTIKDLFKKK